MKLKQNAGGTQPVRNRNTKKLIKLVSVLLVVLVAVLLSACKSKEPVTADVFQQTLEGQGYTVVDIADQYAEFEHILSAVASEQGGVHIEFYEINSKENAAAMFQGNRNTVESFKGNGSAESSISVGNYQKYSLSTGDQQYVVVRVDDTMIYAYCDKTQKDALSGLIDALGY